MRPESPSSAFRALFLAAALAPTALAGGSGESAVLVVDPTSAEALYVANYYKAAREIPDANVLYMDPNATDYPGFVSDVQPAFFGSLAGKGIEHVDYVVVMPGTRFYVPAPGLITDSCAAVNRFGIAAPYTLAFNSTAILNGTPSSRINRYFGSNDTAIAFDSSISWLSGMPSNQSTAERYFVGALLGYTGERGNPVAELIDMIDRGVGIDGTQPLGTFYFQETTDTVRSTPRDGFFPAVTTAINALGGMAEHQLADMPIGETDCQGIMTGLAGPNIAGGNFTVLPGAFCDHLTSFAGMFDNGSQTKMSEWVTKGASGTSGTVEEPCNYPGKFPHARMHLYYYQGLSLGEAWLRSMRYYPYQNLLYGDPLTRPYAAIPTVDVPDAPGGPVSGTIYLTPTAIPGGAAQVVDLELYADGQLRRTGTLGDALPLQTRLLDDGWHELRVLAYDDTDVRNVGSWIGWVEVANHGESATVAASVTSGDLGTAFDFDLAAPGATASELRLVSSGRVLGTTTSNPGTVRVHGQNLGAGPVRVQTEALLASGRRAWSAPLDVSVDFSGGGAGASPEAYDHVEHLRVDLTSVVELPASYADAPADASFTVVTPPAQATVVPGATGGFRILRPDAGATGTDTLVFRVTTPSGVSNDATVAIVYDPGLDCPDPASYCMTAPNSVGPGATITFVGSTSVAANDVTLWAAGARPGQPGIFYYGPNQIVQPFGDGFRCVGGGGIGIFRLPVITTDSFGDATYDLDLNTPPAGSGPGEIQAGSTWNFQYWYRDPGGPGGSNFNLSDAVSATFCP